MGLTPVTRFTNEDMDNVSSCAILAKANQDIFENPCQAQVFHLLQLSIS